MVDFEDDGTPIIRIGAHPEDQLEHEARVARAGAWEMKLAMLLQRCALYDQEPPQGFTDIAPLYLRQACLLSEDPDLRAEMMAALTR